MASEFRDSVVVKIDNTANIRSISKIYPEILSAVFDAHSVVLDLAPEAEVDLSFVQLIEAARLHAGPNGKTLALARPAGGSLLNVLERAGFIESASDEDAQFWLHKGSVQ